MEQEPVAFGNLLKPLSYGAFLHACLWREKLRAATDHPHSETPFIGHSIGTRAESSALVT